jgi:hypothetical protein
MLRPHGRDFFGVDLVWLTDMDVPDREALGLTMNLQPCDRLEFQYVVDVEDAVKWSDSDLRRSLYRRPGFDGFEEGRQPDRWWIVTHAVLAFRNRHYAAPANEPSARIRFTLDANLSE